MSKIPMFPNKFAIFASILGGVQSLGEISNSNIDSATTTGIYFVTGNDASAFETDDKIMVAFKFDNNWTLQIAMAINRKSDGLKCRFKQQSRWSEWY